MEILREHRYEIKYALEPSDVYMLQQILVIHPSRFKRSFPDRWINNLYFDTPSWQFCHENLSGVSNRTKVRYRWYGDPRNFDKGVLEYKIRRNQIGKKERVTMTNISDMIVLEREVNRHTNAGHLIACLQNRYRRSYFEDITGKFRLTIDRDLTNRLADRMVSDMVHSHFSEHRIIVEVKFNATDYKMMDTFSEAFPFRVTKHSKYVTGLMSLVYA